MDDREYLPMAFFGGAYLPFSFTTDMPVPKKFDGYSNLSYEDPADYGFIFTTFFNKNLSRIIALNLFKQNVDETNEYIIMTGHLNVLFGDGPAVKKKTSLVIQQPKTGSSAC